MAAEYQIWVAVDGSGQVRHRRRLEDAEAAGAQLVLGDDVVREGDAGDRVLDGDHLAVVNVGGVAAVR